MRLTRVVPHPNVLSRHPQHCRYHVARLHPVPHQLWTSASGPWADKR